MRLSIYVLSSLCQAIIVFERAPVSALTGELPCAG